MELLKPQDYAAAEASCLADILSVKRGPPPCSYANPVSDGIGPLDACTQGADGVRLERNAFTNSGSTLAILIKDPSPSADVDM